MDATAKVPCRDYIHSPARPQVSRPSDNGPRLCSQLSVRNTQTCEDHALLMNLTHASKARAETPRVPHHPPRVSPHRPQLSMTLALPGLTWPYLLFHVLPCPSQPFYILSDLPGFCVSFSDSSFFLLTSGFSLIYFAVQVPPLHRLVSDQDQLVRHCNKG